MGPAMTERADTLDGLLDELPDFSTSDLFAVDQFWPNYVNALEQKGMQDAPMEPQFGEYVLSFWLSCNMKSLVTILASFFSHSQHARSLCP